MQPVCTVSLVASFVGRLQRCVSESEQPVQCICVRHYHQPHCTQVVDSFIVGQNCQSSESTTMAPLLTASCPASSNQQLPVEHRILQGQLHTAPTHL